ncbi:MAG TPA: DnaJ C-terminal domain-containing protein [Opitutaceae bacterium]
MSVEFKDYYATLGVARDASDTEIKKAFRKLARLYHPDIAKDKKTAEAKFKEINEAYEVLGEPAKRRRYDELGAHWQEGGPPPPPRARRAADGAYREYHFGGTGFSDFFEQFFGRGARAGDFGDLFREASRGAGAGGEAEFAMRGSDIEGDILVTLDEVLNGSLRTISLQHTDSRSGEVETETFKVRIPPGAQEGRRIRVPGKGEPGSNGAAAGDLFLRVRVAAHPDFRVRGSDLVHELDLAPWEAVLGTEVMVPSLAGRVKLRVPAGTNNGQQLRLRGLGLPAGADGHRGDLYVAVNVQLPEQISAEERELWERLSRVATFHPRGR